jgi:hypothetical protein
VEIDTSDNVIVTLNSVSENYYKYFKSINVLNALNSEEIYNQENFYYNVYTNVENGAGIFAGFNSYTDTVVYKGVVQKK